MPKLRRWLRALWKAKAGELIVLCFILVLFPILTWSVGKGSDSEFTLIVIGLVGDLVGIIGFILKYNPEISKLVKAAEKSKIELKELRKSVDKMTEEITDIKEFIRSSEESELKLVGKIRTEKKTDFGKVQASIDQLSEYTQNLADFTLKLLKMNESEVVDLLEEWSIQDILDYSSLNFNIRQYQVCELCYRAILARDEKNVDALNDLGAVLLTIERYEEAIEFLERALAIDPESAITLSNIGHVYNGLNKLQDAERFYRKSTEANDKFAGAFTSLSRLLRITEKPSEALTVAQEGAAIFPQDSDLRTEIGRVFYSLDKYEEAIVELDKAIKLDYNNDYAHFSLGLVYYANTQNIVARDEFKIACNINRTIPNYWQMYALACMELDLTSETIDAFMKSEELEPDNPRILFMIGLMYLKKELYNEALPYLKRTFNILPEDWGVKQNYAICLASLNRIEEMNTLLNLKSGETPEDAAILAAAFLGIVSEGTPPDYQVLEDFSIFYKKWNRLHIYAEKIIKVNPEMDIVRILLFGHYLQEGEYEKGLLLLEDGLALNPLNNDLLINKTSVLIQLERYQEAYEYLTSLVKEFPEDSTVLGNYGTALVTRGEYVEARNYLKKSLSINPNAEFYKSKLEMLDESEEDDSEEHN